MEILQVYWDEDKATCNACHWTGKLSELGSLWVRDAIYDAHSEECCPQCESQDLQFEREGERK